MQTESPPQKTSPNRLAHLGLIFGFVMLGIAVLWVNVVRSETPQKLWYPTDHILSEILLGIGIGILATGVAWYLSVTILPIRHLSDRIMTVLDFQQMTIGHAILFGLLASIPEETLFRGAIQPEIGITLTALIFGTLHAISPLYFFYTFLAGIGLGLVAAWRGDLWAVTSLHWCYDTLLFILMMWRAKQNATIIDNNL